MCRDDNCIGRSLSQLDKEAVEYMYERRFSSRGLEDSMNCADMKGEGRCSRSREVQGHYTPKLCPEGAGEDSGREDKEECGDRDRRRAAGV